MSRNGIKPICLLSSYAFGLFYNPVKTQPAAAFTPAGSFPCTVLKLGALGIFRE